MKGENMEIKEGDWLFYEFRLVKVKEIENSHITVSTGWIEMGNISADHCFPLTLSNKIISDQFDDLYQKLHKNYRNLNWPDIRRWMANKWAEACAVSENEKEMRRRFSDEANDYVNEIISEAENLSFKTVGGMKPFRL